MDFEEELHHVCGLTDIVKKVSEEVQTQLQQLQKQVMTEFGFDIVTNFSVFTGKDTKTYAYFRNKYGDYPSVTSFLNTVVTKNYQQSSHRQDSMDVLGTSALSIHLSQARYKPPCSVFEMGVVKDAVVDSDKRGLLFENLMSDIQNRCSYGTSDVSEYSKKLKSTYVDEFLTLTAHAVQTLLGNKLVLRYAKVPLFTKMNKLLGELDFLVEDVTTKRLAVVELKTTDISDTPAVFTVLQGLMYCDMLHEMLSITYRPQLYVLMVNTTTKQTHLFKVSREDALQKIWKAIPTIEIDLLFDDWHITPVTQIDEDDEVDILAKTIDSVSLKTEYDTAIDATNTFRLKLLNQCEKLLYGVLNNEKDVFPTILHELFESKFRAIPVIMTMLNIHNKNHTNTDTSRNLARLRLLLFYAGLRTLVGKLHGIEIYGTDVASYTTCVSSLGELSTHLILDNAHKSKILPDGLKGKPWTAAVVASFSHTLFSGRDLALLEIVP